MPANTLSRSVLLVDDEAEESAAIAAALARRRFTVSTATSDSEAAPAQAARFDLLVSKLRLGGNGAGMRLVRSWRSARPETPIVAIANPADTELAVEAMRLGAADCLLQPVHLQKLNASLRRILALRSDDAVPGSHEDVEGPSRFCGLVGNDPAMQEVYRKAEFVAATPSTVLITGPTGTGKELVAAAIHKLSPRSEGPFVAVNVAAVPHTLMESELFGHEKGAFTDAINQRAGRFEVASGGTLFIDEIGDLGIQSQAKLLRVLETRIINRVGSNENRPVDVRVVAATSRDLEEMVGRSQFRADLYYRLNVVHIDIPPLRRRPDDIPLLVEHFLTATCSAHDRPVPSMSAELTQALRAHPWPGNVRQLKNCVESMVVMARSEELTVQDLPPYLDLHVTKTEVGDLRLAGMTLENLEREAIQQSLQRCQGNRAKTARALGISVRTLQRKIKQLSAHHDSRR